MYTNASCRIEKLEDFSHSSSHQPKMMFSKRKLICCKRNGGVKSLSFITFIILSCHFVQTYSFAKGGQSSVKAIHVNQRKSVGNLVKLRTEIKNTLLKEKEIEEKASKTNQHKIEKKSSLSAEHGISDETDLVPFYSDIFYEEKIEPPQSTVSPFGKYQLKFINNKSYYLMISNHFASRYYIIQNV